MNSQATLTRAAEKRAATLIYFAAFSFVIMIGSMQVLVPLYGLHLGYDIKALGFIIARKRSCPSSPASSQERWGTCSATVGCWWPPSQR